VRAETGRRVAIKAPDARLREESSDLRLDALGAETERRERAASAFLAEDLARGPRVATVMAQERGPPPM